ncbi:phosphoenolpyruvate carboxylase [Roseibacillus ishigakijimensis]|uniref:Phosphoenolpyruvate carboxylase n=1 Tax=Roseibacillus ishigakijimensis TaxID=454146 RepID=A0A934RRG2_9BACT|nr:phosphoenolpyruvate carboxylase [Roseibacillus ishigakijimensis]MBK1834552.1 phosphoenolpyruvate carboxylase [Roseibacillus ishigakijimensis]
MPNEGLNQAYFDRGFQALEDELREVTSTLAGALPLSKESVSRLPWLGETSPLEDNPEDAAEAAQLSSLAFEILNIVEERVAWRFRAIRRAEFGPETIRGLWPGVIARMKEAGLSEEEALEAFRKVEVEPVLTAHPTEAKRPLVREKHLAIYNRLAEWEDARLDPLREKRVRDSLSAEFESLWQTGEIFVERPTIADERRNALYYLREVFPEVVIRLNRSLEVAWEAAGWSLANLREARAYPRISFASWIGGDRDGHPFVTPEVTRNTFAEMRYQALRLHRRACRKSAEALTESIPFVTVPPALEEGIARLTRELGDAGTAIAKRNEAERWRCWLYLVREKMDRSLNQTSGGYATSEDYQEDLELARWTLCEAGAKLAAREWIEPLLLLNEVFGFHLAKLDIRNNSSSHDQALAAILESLGIEDGENFPDWSEEQRVEFLLAELANRRPLLSINSELPEEAENILGYLRVVAEQEKLAGPDSLGQLIISMTRQVSDLLVMHLFAREAGLADYVDGFWRSRLPVSPLFETGDDLAAAADILGRYRDLMSGGGESLQPAMVGYSDSNKDAGVFASQWGIHRAQKQMAEALSERYLEPQFFHGRGGTIGRGAGPTQWFLRALPPGCLTGPVRLTEQGEVLPRKYSHEGNAHYHLELLMAGVSEAVAMQDQRTGVPEAFHPTLDRLAETSSQAYRALLTSEDFITFHRSATPIDALEVGTFGSRPSRRTGKPSLKDLRAIPWVFSWTQSRFYLPGWFGVGSGLETLQKEDPDTYAKLQESFSDIAFLRYVFTNVETSLASANLDLIESYAALCEDDALRERILTTVREEFQRTREQVGTFLGGDFATRRPRMNKTLALREEPLRKLHRQQIALLKDWRAAGSPTENEDGTANQTFLALQLTINAISSGLKETG